MLVKSVCMRELSGPAGSGSGSGADGLSEDSGRTYRLRFFYFLMSLRPPGQWQASHILCKYALVRSSAGAFSPVRSPQILISQVTVVDLQPVCCCRHNRSSFTDKFLGVWGPFFAFPATAAVCFSLLLTTSVVIKFHLSLDFLFYISIAVFGFFSGRTLIYILNNCIISP